MADELIPVENDKFSNQVTEFAGETFEKTKDDFEFKKWMQDRIKDEYNAGNIKATQLMALYSNEYINETDRIQKTMSPLSQVLVAKTQAEQKQAAQTAVQINVGNQKAEAEISKANLDTKPKQLQGAVEFQRLLETLMTNPQPKKIAPAAPSDLPQQD